MYSKERVGLLIIGVLLMGLIYVMPAQAKSRTNLLTPEAIANIRKTQTWAGHSISAILTTADSWMKYTPQQLRALVPPAWMPRAYDINFKQDPIHGEDIMQFGKYPYIISPDNPYKIICPLGGEVYPSNDIDPTRPPSPTNISSEPYIDYGWGWQKPGETQKYWFVAYYTHWLWHNHIRPVTRALGEAYIITGDQKYARQALILLDRIAEEYPQMDYVKQSRVGTEIQPGNYPGRILNNVWETQMAAELAQAYDYAYEGMVGDALLEQATGKSVSEIRSNIEMNLLESAAQSIYTMDERIRGNFGMHHKTMVTLALVLDNANTDKYIDFVLHNTGGNIWLDEGVVSGLINLIFRDGAPSESAPGYNALWLSQLNEVAKMLQVAGIDLYQQEPKLKRLFDYPLRVVMAKKFSPNIGDSGSLKAEGIVGWNNSLYENAYAQYGDRAYLLGDPLTAKSDNMSAYGLAMLRSESGTQATGISVYYGQGGGHDHFARLNLEMFAKGYRILPDLGYPEFANANSKKDQAWTRHTISHNVVLVDGRRQANLNGGRLQSFAGLPDVQYVDARAEEAYPGIERYQRSVAMVNAPNQEVYAVDVFRVAGGKQHDYSLHGPDGQFTAAGIDLMAVPGTVAGEDVPYGYLYDAVNLEQPGFLGPYGGYYGSGFSYLTNVQRGLATQVWDADWQVELSNTHMRGTFVPQKETTVFVADGEPPRNVQGNPSAVKYVLARTQSNNNLPLESTFVTVLQAYTDKPFITAVTPLGEGLPSGAVGTVGLQIDHANGRDYVFQAIDTNRTMHWGSDYAFQGSLGVIARTNGGAVRHMSLIGGGLVRQGNIQLQAGGSYTGQISQVDYVTGKIRITLDPQSPQMPTGSVLDGERIVISNAEHATEYQISQVTALGGNLYELEVYNSELLTGKGLVNSVTERSGSTIISTLTPMILNAYYNGQWLVNPQNGKAGRIASFTSNGGNIVVETQGLGLQKDDCFQVYDFAQGDRFQISSAISVQSVQEGSYEVISNVPGKLTLWDGAEYALVPGKQTVSVSTLVIVAQQLPLDEEGNISGLISPEFEIQTKGAELQLRQVTVSIDDTVVYTGALAPGPRQLHIDTTAWDDGKHELVIRATDSFGITVARTIPITIKNWWVIASELPEPVSTGWFGVMDFTGIYERSAGWIFTKDAPADFYNDDHRMVREHAQQEYITWEAPALTQFELIFYAKEPVEVAAVSVAVSADNQQWSALPFVTEITGSANSGWQRIEVSGQLSNNKETRYFRLLLPADIPAESLQLGWVSLRGQRL